MKIHNFSITDFPNFYKNLYYSNSIYYQVKVMPLLDNCPKSISVPSYLPTSLSAHERQNQMAATAIISYHFSSMSSPDTVSLSSASSISRSLHTVRRFPGVSIFSPAIRRRISCQTVSSYPSSSVNGKGQITFICLEFELRLL